MTGASIVARPPRAVRQPILFALVISVGLVGLAVAGTKLDQPPQRIWVADVAVSVAVQLGFVLAAALLSREEGQGRTALILAVAAVCEIFGGIQTPLPGAWNYVASIIGPLFWVFAGWALLRFPYQAVLRSEERRFLLVAALWLGPGHMLINSFLDPRWHPDLYAATTWWPTVGHWHGVYEHLRFVEVAIDALVALWYASITIRRIRSMSGVDRWIIAPMAASIVAAVGPLVVRPPAYFFGDETVKRAADAVMVGVMLLIPAAFITVLVRRRITRSAIADMMTTLSGDFEPRQVIDALRTALRDPTLEIRFWSPETVSFVDVDGRDAPAPDDLTRLRIPVTGSDGTQLAELDVNGDLRHHRPLVNAAVSASALAIENAQLHAALRAQLEATRASRRRIAEVGVEERRRLERDLHDGVQQRLLALTLRLSDMRAHGSDTGTVVEATRAELHAALAELRDLARGIHPTVLAQSGLAPALEDVVDRLPLAVTIEIPRRRWPTAVEATAYFVVCEALSNAVKHAEAACVSVTARVGDDGTLHLQVCDDGRGGARACDGGGLAGIHDRVRALGGDLQLDSPLGGGTRLRIELPCEE